MKLPSFVNHRKSPMDFPIAWIVLAFAVGVQEDFLEIKQEAGM
jgi:hypothetical protein